MRSAELLSKLRHLKHAVPRQCLLPKSWRRGRRHHMIWVCSLAVHLYFLCKVESRLQCPGVPAIDAIRTNFHQGCHHVEVQDALCVLGPSGRGWMHRWSVPACFPGIIYGHTSTLLRVRKRTVARMILNNTRSSCFTLHEMKHYVLIVSPVYCCSVCGHRHVLAVCLPNDCCVALHTVVCSYTMHRLVESTDVRVTTSIVHHLSTATTKSSVRYLTVTFIYLHPTVFVGICHECVHCGSHLCMSGCAATPRRVLSFSSC